MVVIVERATHRGAYAQLIRDTCLAHLDEALPPMDALLVPDDLRDPFARMRAALVALRGAYDALQRYLDQLPDAFDAEDQGFRDVANDIARAWHDYKVAYGEVNTILRGHLDE